MRAKDYRARGREALSGRWLSVVGATFIATLLGGSIPISGSTSVFSLISNFGSRSADDSGTIGGTGGLENRLGILTALIGISAILLLINVIRMLIGATISLGLVKYNLELIDRKSPDLGTLFGCTNMFGKALGLRIVVGIFISLWSLLLIIPGIVKTYSYFMAGFIMEENPEIGIMEAIRVSRKMMDGHKWELFCLELSFIGWALLCVVTCGIGLLWLTPYINASVTAFYDEISRQSFEV